MNNVNGISFKGQYLIPYNQVKNSETMQKIAQASAQYITDPNQVTQAPDGIVIDIDDKRAKEYEAVIAKYGVSIQKYDKNSNANKKAV